MAPRYHSVILSFSCLLSLTANSTPSDVAQEEGLIPERTSSCLAQPGITSSLQHPTRRLNLSIYLPGLLNSGGPRENFCAKRSPPSSPPCSLSPPAQRSPAFSAALSWDCTVRRKGFWCHPTPRFVWSSLSRCTYARRTRRRRERMRERETRAWHACMPFVAYTSIAFCWGRCLFLGRFLSNLSRVPYCSRLPYPLFFPRSF